MIEMPPRRKPVPVDAQRNRRTAARRWAKLALAATLTLVGLPLARADDPPTQPLPEMSNEEAWNRLPQQPRPLPAWARALAGPLPRTTAGMLHLDFVHRAQDPLDPQLRAKLRWTAADANRCAYGRRYAEADLRRAGASEAQIANLTSDGAPLDPAEHRALAFARKLSLAAAAITDDEVAELVADFGPEKVVAIVHTLAFANFQDRILLALGTEVEPEGPLAPADVWSDPQNLAKIVAPPRRQWPQAAAAPPSVVQPDWAPRGLDDLHAALERQQARSPRIQPPSARVLAANVPARDAQIVWSRVSYGYQPQLTGAWFDCLRAFHEESQLDPVFGNSLFLVVTRQNDCFY
jgi:alkylhydroperoxidase family enzyme